MLDVNEHRIPDHLRTFMKMMRGGGTNTLSASNNERCQVLIPRVIWGGSIDRFEVLEIMLKVI
jgi:hypothetical protein